MEKEIVTDQSGKSESMTVGDEDQIGQLAEKQLSWKSDFPGQKANVRKADQMLASTGNKRIVSDVLSADWWPWATLPSFCLHSPLSLPFHPCLVSPPLPFSLLYFLTSLPLLSLPLIFMLIQLNVFVYFHLMLEAKPSEQSYRKTSLPMDLQPLSKPLCYICLPQSTREKHRQKQPPKSLSCFFFR